MLYRETGAVCSEIHTNVEFLNIKLMIYKVASVPYRATIYSCLKVSIFHSVVDKHLFFTGCCLLPAGLSNTYRLLGEAYCVLLHGLPAQTANIKAVSSYKP
jgi:hypothetical protein